MLSTRRVTAAALVAAVVVCAAAAVSAQRFMYREGSAPARYAPREMPDAAFAFCRLEYRSVRTERSGIGWRTDYPYAEINLMTRLSELTRVRISRDEYQDPNHYVVRLTDDALFSCPFTMASDIGTVGFNEAEVRQLRLYLQKGGFLWVDDFWGNMAWTQWASQIARVLPPSEYPIEDIPLDDPILRSMFEIQQVPQITNIQFWRSVNGLTTSERGPETDVVNFRAIRDTHGRVMVLMTHNTDVADAWEREGEDPGFFYQFSPAGYALGVNVLLHALTH